MNNPAVTNMVISLGAMQLARKIPTDEPQVMFYLRIAYVATQVLSLAFYYYLTMVIKKKNDLTVLKYVQPAAPMSQEEGQLITTTVKDYDLTEVGKAMRGLFTGIAFMAFLHGYMKYTQPLFIQSLMTLKAVLEANETKLHFWSKPATGDLARPFKAAGGLLEQLTGQGGAPATDKASIRAAEKPGVGGKKDE